MQQWLEKFHYGDFKLEDVSRSDRPKAIQDHDAEALVEAYPLTVVEKGLRVSKTAVTDSMERLGKMKRLEK